MKVSTQRKIPSIWDALAKRHVAEADRCLEFIQMYEDRGDLRSVYFWQRIWKEKQQDAENVRTLGAEL